jgi:hypothetical protein
MGSYYNYNHTHTTFFNSKGEREEKGRGQVHLIRRKEKVGDTCNSYCVQKKRTN